jgi:hypothetical protein
MFIAVEQGGKSWDTLLAVFQTGTVKWIHLLRILSRFLRCCLVMLVQAV